MTTTRLEDTIQTNDTETMRKKQADAEMELITDVAYSGIPSVILGGAGICVDAALGNFDKPYLSYAGLGLGLALGVPLFKSLRKRHGEDVSPQQTGVADESTYTNHAAGAQRSHSRVLPALLAAGLVAGITTCTLNYAFRSVSSQKIQTESYTEGGYKFTELRGLPGSSAILRTDHNSDSALVVVYDTLPGNQFPQRAYAYRISCADPCTDQHLVEAFDHVVPLISIRDSPAFKQTYSHGSNQLLETRGSKEPFVRQPVRQPTTEEKTEFTYRSLQMYERVKEAFHERYPAKKETR